jgi:hypothetical protein
MAKDTLQSHAQVLFIANSKHVDLLAVSKDY